MDFYYEEFKNFILYNLLILFIKGQGQRQRQRQREKTKACRQCVIRKHVKNISDSIQII